MMEASPHARHLVFIGGGHSHALTLRMLGMDPFPGVRLSLISDVTLAPYSGMVPGHIAGYYSHADVHIDLRRLCQFAGASFIHASVTGLDPTAQLVELAGRPPVGYDVASINIGSTPQLEVIAGADAIVIPVKPVPALLAGWERIRAAAAAPGGVPHVAIIGGGAGGVELALSMKRALGDSVRLSIWHRGAALLGSHAPRARALLLAQLAGLQITVHLQSPVVRVDSGGLHTATAFHPADFIIGAVHAAPPAWLQSSGLALDDKGFIKVSDALQSPSHPNIFAAGDIASLATPRPKSGVFAVRMAAPLCRNLRRHLCGVALQPYRPQRAFLSLIGTGDGAAIATRGAMAYRSPLLWRLKDRIDRAFMRRFSDLQPMEAEAPPVAASASGATDSLPTALASLQRRATMRCLGCAAKVGSTVLSRTMSRLREEFPECTVSPPPELGIETGLAAADDAAVVRIAAGHRLVQTVDYMPALVADPWLFGRIAALHCFSDIFAMGAEPHSALAACLIPFGDDRLTGELLYQLLSGVLHVLRESGACLTGGHTAEGQPLALALTCNGLLHQSAALTKGGLQSGDALILTKPLGTGTLFAAEMRLRTPAPWIDAALASMSLSNLPASRILRAHGVLACTDVTGFGLAGHLLEMLRPSNHGATLHLDATPLLAGALETTRAGILSSLQSQNQVAVSAIANSADYKSHTHLPLLFDPQTSGGLLAGVPAGAAAACLAALRAGGAPEAAIIGSISAGGEFPLTLA